MATGASTTIAGEQFIRTPLNAYEPPALTLGLPGLGKTATEQLAQYANIKTPAQVFGLYVFLNGDGPLFIEYLEKECRVVFQGGSRATAAEIKQALCDTLEAKWLIVQNY